MSRAVLRLALRRLRARVGSAVLLGAAVAAATGLVAVLFAISLVATDRAIGGALAALDDGDQAIRVSAFRPSGSDAAHVLATVEAGDTEPEPPVRGVIFRRTRPLGTDVDVQLLAADAASSWVRLTEGHAPASCSGRTCEAVALSEVPLPAGLPATLRVRDLELRIVGRGLLASGVPFGRPDQSGARAFAPDPYNLEVDPPPLLLLVDGVDAVAASEAVAVVGRTYLATRPVAPDAVQPWTVDTLRSRVAAIAAWLTAAGLDHTYSSPLGTIDAELARGRVADGRLLLVGSLAIAILLAFAVFAALLGRADLALELDRLDRAGASRAARATLVVTETLVPAIGGAVAGWVLGVGVAAGLAAAQGSDASAIAAAVAFGAGPVLAAAGVTVLVVLAAVGASTVRPERGTVAGLLPGLAVAGAVLAWQAVAGGVLGPSGLAGGSTGPIVVLLPATVAFALAALALGLLPPLLRRASRAARRLPLVPRLALLSVARQPGRPAATLTVLAFSLGTLVFAVGYASTLRAGIAEQAAFAAGADLRVTEAGSGLTLSSTVVPFDRYAASLPEGVTASPVHRRSADLPDGSDVEILGAVPEALGRIRGWRADFVPEAPAELGRRIAVPGDFTLRGHDLPAGSRELAFTLSLQGARVRLTAVVATERGDFASVPLGAFVPGRHEVRATVPEEAAGGRVVALDVGDAIAVAGPYHEGSLGTSTIAVSGLEGLVDAQPRTLEAKGLEFERFVAPSPADGLVLPAIVSPAVAAAAAASGDGTATLALTDRSAIRLRPVATADWFPTVDEPGRPFAVVALDPLLAAVNTAAPGAGRPDEAWIDAGGPGSPLTADVAAALARPPFRSATVVAADALEQARAADPFAASIVWALVAASAAGLALAVLGILLGAIADRRDEAGELRDLEAQGLGPAALARLVAARTVGTTAAGSLVGVVVGVTLTILVAVGIGVSADLAVPVPPLRPVVPADGVVVLAALPVAIAGVASLLAGGRRRGAAGGREGPAVVRSDARDLPA